MVRLDARPLTRQDIPQDDEWPDGVVLPPTNLESDEPPLETDLHREQIDLLIRLLKAIAERGEPGLLPSISEQPQPRQK